jgi:diphthine-ammonia ligase
MTEAFVSWSGGKDSCLACYRAVTSGIKIRYLLNMVTEEGRWSRSHGLDSKFLQVQAEAMGIPLVQQRTTDTNYAIEFKKALRAFKQEGITAGVFGDIDFNEHRQWIERVCAARGVVPLLPLWENDQEEILKDFIHLGFESVVVATKADLLGEEWLGRKVDSTFLADLKELRKTKNITLCGEAGEYHTYVINGPLFGKRVEIHEANKELKDNHWFLRVKQCELEPKRKFSRGQK